MREKERNGITGHLELHDSYINFLVGCTDGGMCIGKIIFCPVNRGHLIDLEIIIQCPRSKPSCFWSYTHVVYLSIASKNLSLDSLRRGKELQRGGHKSSAF